MQKQIKDGDLEFKLFQDFWKFRKSCYEPKTEEEFEKVTKLVDEFIQPYKKTELEWFARQLFLLHCEDAERRFRNV